MDPIRSYSSANPPCIINDIEKGCQKYSDEEKVLRCKLAILYRLVDYFGWTQTTYNHISLKLSDETYLINPFGLLYQEVTASNLLQVSTSGEVLNKDDSILGLNVAGFTLHSAIHEARSDIKCVIHLHTPDVIAVSAMECGLLPLSQESLIVGDVSYYPYEGILVDPNEMDNIKKYLGPHNKVMILENHGLVACGETVEEAFHYLYHVMIACTAQIKALSAMPKEKLKLLDREEMKSRTEGVARSNVVQGAESKWKLWDIQFEALARNFDKMGLKTGYPFFKPQLLTTHQPTSNGF